MRRVLHVLIPLALVLLAGCPSLSTLQTPSTVPKGQLRFGVGLEGVGYSENGDSVTVPQTEFSARYGASDDLDVGAKLYFLGVEVGAKYQFLRGEFDAAVAPAISYISFSASSNNGEDDASLSIAYIHLPLLFGYNISDTLTLGFGPKALYIISTASASSGEETSSATADGLMAGGYIQIAYRMGDAFWVAPEFNLYKPFQEGTEGFFFQGGLGLFFGGAPNKQPMGQPMGQPIGPPGGAPAQ